jgi:nitroreductase
MEFADVVRQCKMVRSFTEEALPPGTADRLLRVASRAPSAGFSQGYSFLVLEGDDREPLWELLYDASASDRTTADDGTEQVDALKRAPLVIVPLACKDIYLDRYARPDKGLDRDEAVHPIPYWYIDAGFTALLTLLAVFFGIGGFRARYGVPPQWDPIGAVAIGYPDPGTDPVPPAPATASPSLTSSTADAGRDTGAAGLVPEPQVPAQGAHWRVLDDRWPPPVTPARRRAPRPCARHLDDPGAALAPARVSRAQSRRFWQRGRR